MQAAVPEKGWRDVMSRGVDEYILIEMAKFHTRGPSLIFHDEMLRRTLKMKNASPCHLLISCYFVFIHVEKPAVLR